MEGIATVLVVGIVFGSITALILGPFYLYFRARSRDRLLQTLRVAFEKGQPLPPEMLASVSSEPQRPTPAPERDLRRGVILLAVAAAFVVMAFAVGAQEEDAMGPLLSIAAFPGFIGLGHLAFWIVARRRERG